VEVEVIYKEVNKEIRVAKEGEPVYEIIEKCYDSPLTFRGQPDVYGHFIHHVCALEGQDAIYIISTWNPAPGYSWEEVVVTKIKIPV